MGLFFSIFTHLSRMFFNINNYIKIIILSYNISSMYNNNYILITE